MKRKIPRVFSTRRRNARLVASAERYYRIIYYGDADLWNLRDTHMFETLEHVLDGRGAVAKAVVWAHNSHIGDARQTEMGAVRGELNIGQLCRERFGAESVALIGMGTHQGTVAAADDWDGDMKVKRVNPSRADSVERLFHDAGVDRCLLDLSRDSPAARSLRASRLERFIGVIYRLATECRVTTPKCPCPAVRRLPLVRRDDGCYAACASAHEARPSRHVSIWALGAPGINGNRRFEQILFAINRCRMIVHSEPSRLNA